jgi:hypothetical protein
VYTKSEHAEVKSVFELINRVCIFPMCTYQESTVLRFLLLSSSIIRLMSKLETLVGIAV